jgi:hypothetical protein
MKPVIITTQHRGVFFGYLSDDQDLQARSLPLSRARMAIYWGTERGVMQLAESGPTQQSKIGSVANIPMLHDVTAVFEVTKEAEEKWIALS